MFASNPEFYSDYAKTDSNDVQIIYSGPSSAEKGLGHYVCIYYDAARNRVTVYDTLHVVGRSFGSKSKSILQRLYPNLNTDTGIEFVRPKTLQNDFCSCGIFSIAHATAIIFNRMPENILLKVNCLFDQAYYLRKHLKQILLTKELRPFPTTTTHSYCSKAKNAIFQSVRWSKKVLE